MELIRRMRSALDEWWLLAAEVVAGDAASETRLVELMASIDDLAADLAAIDVAGDAHLPSQARPAATDEGFDLGAELAAARAAGALPVAPPAPEEPHPCPAPSTPDGSRLVTIRDGTNSADQRGRKEERPHSG